MTKDVAQKSAMIRGRFSYPSVPPPKITVVNDGYQFKYINDAVEGLKHAFASGQTKNLSWREAQLDGLIEMLTKHKDAFVDAVHRDLGKPEFEAWTTDVRLVINRLRLTRKKLRGWVKAKRVSTLQAVQPAKSIVVREPLGVVLIIGPWNFPVDLCLSPMAGALAAGNCVLLKPSEVAPLTSALLTDLIPRYLDKDCVKVIEGAVPETTELLRHRFNHIFYTGNGQVGRIVLRAAAEHLTPVTLELGGKNPCIIDASAKIDITARRVLWGKFYNCGQACVAPDYLLVHEAIYDELLVKLKETIHQFYGDDPKKSPDYARIVNRRHHRRLMRLLSSGGNILLGGEADEADRYIAPTLLTEVPPDAAILQEEIFGPLLPILKVQNIEDAVTYVNDRPKPLALYVFTERREVHERVIEQTSSGGVCVNAVNLHPLGDALPFGGVGESGVGKYHGRFSIDTFSNLKSVLHKATWADPDLIYPPLTKSKRRWLQRLL